MISRKLACLTIGLLAMAPLPAGAATDLDLPRFEAVSLEGGGHVTLRHGPRQQVRILRGDPTVSSFEVRNRGSLHIAGCRSSCPKGYRLEVEIVSPEIDAVAVSGGGAIELAPGFPKPGSLALAVHGGGSIDAQSVEARHVAASVEGGGAIRAWATGSLAASVRGGGLVAYRGDPTLATAVRGGGSVTRISR